MQARDLLDSRSDQRSLELEEDSARGWHVRNLTSAFFPTLPPLSRHAAARPSRPAVHATQQAAQLYRMLSACATTSQLQAGCHVFPELAHMRTAALPPAGRSAADAAALIALFDEGRSRRNTTNMDLGPAAERTSALFKVTLTQRVPARGGDMQPTQLQSTLTFVDTPGTERLSADPEARAGLLPFLRTG